MNSTSTFTMNRDAVVNSEGGTIQVNSGTTLSLDGDITGTGLLEKQEAGDLILLGDASHTGGTTISAGTLQIGNGGTIGSIAGDVTNDASLVFDRSDALTYGGVISGTGDVTQNGSGALTLTGNNTYAGGTVVHDGTLAVTGSISHTGNAFTVGSQSGDNGEWHRYG